MASVEELRHSRSPWLALGGLKCSSHVGDVDVMCSQAFECDQLCEVGQLLIGAMFDVCPFMGEDVEMHIEPICQNRAVECRPCRDLDRGQRASVNVIENPALSERTDMRRTH